MKRLLEWTTTLWIVVLIAIGFVGESLRAQGTGTVVGAVQDASGAVVPGAEVSLINDRTAVERSASSDEQGRFQFPGMPVGNYHVESALSGFSRFVSEGFKLDVDTTRRVNVTLQVGEVTETVEVTDSVLQVDTEGSTLKETVGVRRIEELPLNGRNPLQLQLLVPGTTTGPGVPSLSANGGVSVNGSRGISNSYMLDGGDNNDPLSNSAAVVPNPDAVAEFTILTNNYEAEYGRNTGAVINVVTKSGTNEFHGTLYEFNRNDNFEARNFFATQASKLNRNQFGGTIGGPIVKNKTFFFFSDEAIRERQGATESRLTVPTPMERVGDFSMSNQRPNDPDTGSPFANDQIPITRIDPASLKFMDALIPLPNSANQRHIFNRPIALDGNQFMGRVDQFVSDKHRLFGRFFRDANTSEGTLVARLPSLMSAVDFETINLTANHTYTPSPNLMNTVQFTFGKSLVDRGPLPVAGGGEVGLGYQDLGINVERGATQDQVDEYGLVHHYRGQVTGFWNMQQNNLVAIDRKTFQYKDDATWIKGGHTIKFGGEYRTSNNDRVTANAVDLQYNFTGRFTDAAMGDFLIGRAASTLQRSLRINKARGRVFGMYVQDRWQLSSNVTLSLGLRYDPFIAFWDANFDPAQISVYRPGLQSTLFPTAPPGLLYGGDLNGEIARGGTPSDLNNFAPRFSIAWRPAPKTSIRTGYGVFYETPRFFQLTNFVNSPPFTVQVRLNDVQFSDPYAGKVNPYPFPGANNLAPDVLQNFEFLNPTGIGISIQDNFVSGYNQQWNFNIQHELADVLLTAAYVGSKASKLPTHQQINPALWRPGATAANTDSRRLDTNFQGISSFNTIGFSSYNALQLTANKRFGHGYTLLAHYTFAKTLDNASQDGGLPAQFSLDPASAKGLAEFHIRHRFVTSFLWELPSPVKSGPLNYVVGGWQANGIFTAQSGSPFDIIAGRDTAICRCGTTRPNLVGNPELSNGRSRAEQIQEFYNTDAFVRPDAGSFGDVGRNIMTGPSFWNIDFALFKNIPIKEAAEVEFRAEFFNFFNHANLFNPSGNISAGNRGQILGASAARVIQFGAKFIF